MGKVFSEVRYWNPTVPKLGLLLAGCLASLSIMPLLLAILSLFANTSMGALVTRLSEDVIYASLRFTVYQATLTTIIVVVLSPALAVALFSLPQNLTRKIILLRTGSFCLPSIIIASGLVLAWGNNGYFTRCFSYFGLEAPFPKILYSQYAVVLANSLMNLPFCTVILFRRLLDIPDEQLRTVSLLGLPPSKVMKSLIWPALRPAVLYFGALTFLLSMGTFGALSILGSGPQSQTLEMAIYHSIYYAADWELGGLLTIIHTALCGFFAMITIAILNRHPLLKSGSKIDMMRHVRVQSVLFQFKPLAYVAVLATLLLDGLILSPIVGIVVHAWGYNFRGFQSPQFETILASIQVSLKFAVPAAFLTTMLSWMITRSYYRLVSQKNFSLATLLQAIAFMVTLIPPMALAFGLLVLLTKTDELFNRQTFIILALLTSMLPFAMAVFMPIYASRLAISDESRLRLGLGDIVFLKEVEWPAIRSTTTLAFALSLALCLNETSIVTTLGDATNPALTTTMIRLMNQYRYGDSAIIATILIALTFLFVFYFHKSMDVQNAQSNL